MSMLQPRTLLGELDRLESLRDPDKLGSRNYKRFVVRGDAEIHPISRNRLDSTPIEVKLRDIGRGGMGFVCQKPIEVGSHWRAHFLHRGYMVGSQALVVRHCRQISEGVYLGGAQFVLDPGLMVLMGVPADEIDAADASMSPDELASFLAPGEVDEQ